jgi:nicotinamidase-related amidase
MAQAHCWDEIIGPEERLMAAHYVGRRTVGSRPALLCIDLYQQVFGDGPEPLETAIERFPASCGPSAWEAFEPIDRMLAAARAAGIPVAHTTGESRPQSQLGGATQRRRDRDDPTVNGYEILEPFRPIDGEYLVVKTRASAFFGTPLSTWLRMRDVDTLIVVGESTSGCVRASVVDAFSHGFKVLVCEDGVFDRSPLSHRMSLFDMHHKYATVASLERSLAYIADREGAATIVSD